MTATAREPHAEPDTAPAGALGREAAEALARTLRAVADPTRLQLLSLIERTENHEATVGELTTGLGLRQPTISHHLRVMVEDGLLRREQRGRNAWYSVTPERRTEINDLLR